MKGVRTEMKLREAFGVVLIALLVFLALHTFWTRDSMNELLNQSSQQNEALEGLTNELNELLNQSSQQNDALEGLANELNELLNQSSQQNEALENIINELEVGILWSYGTGLPGSGEGELYSPHMAEELDGDKVLIVEQKNCAVIVVDKLSGKIVWQFGERGVPGTGKRLDEPHSAHRLPDGRILITEFRGDHRVLIVDYGTKEIEWEYTGCQNPLDAIYWDDEHIMVADMVLGGMGKISKVRLSDQTEVWSFPTPDPFYLQKLTEGGYGQSYGGDLLFGQAGNNGVKEIDTSNGTVEWEYGKDDASWPWGEVYDRPGGAVRAFRYGISEIVDSRNPSLTIIVCEDWSKIFAVNKAKELVWEIGGTTPSGSLNSAFTNFPLLEPTYVSITKKGNLLITDHGQNKVFELNPYLIPPRTDKEALIYSDNVSDSWSDSQIAEVVGYKTKNVVVFNTGSYDMDWRLLASPNAQDWVEIKKADTLAAGDSSYYVVTDPWRFIKAQVRSTTAQTTTADIYLHASRE
jgi:hypothetical protein